MNIPWKVVGFPVGGDAVLHVWHFEKRKDAERFAKHLANATIQSRIEIAEVVATWERPSSCVEYKILNAASCKRKG